MDYEAVLAKLFRARRAGIDLGLERIERCLPGLEHPERGFVSVHIGGTNGKGSTAAFVDAIARSAGCRTGLFTSPHLATFRERFLIDGRPASEEQVVAAAAGVARAGGSDLTFFEQTTLMGLWLFARAGVDLAVVEVGLGGRLDATNVVPAAVAAVTGVARDHTEYLGDSLAAIAGEKAGIFKPGQRVVIGRAGEPEAVPWLVEHARRRGVAAITVVDSALGTEWDMGLSGGYQRDNAACALAIAYHLRDLGLLAADEDCCRQGLARARLHGRYEIVASSPTVLLDGAHNAAGARRLAAEIAELPRPLIAVIAVSQGKDAAGVLAPILARVSGAIVTQVAGSRAMPAASLVEVARNSAAATECRIAADIREALALARGLAGHGGTIVVTGSLYLVGEARQVLCGDRPDPIPVSDPHRRKFAHGAGQ